MGANRPLKPRSRHQTSLWELQQRATFSLAAPVTAYILALLFQEASALARVTAGLFMLVLAALGFSFGLVAFIGLRRELGKGLWKAVVGMCLSGLILLIFISVLLAGRQALNKQRATTTGTRSDTVSKATPPATRRNHFNRK